MKQEYFYSEGYIYKGTETICKLYGTDKEKESAAKLFLNQSPTQSKLTKEKKLNCCLDFPESQCIDKKNLDCDNCISKRPTTQSKSAEEIREEVRNTTLDLVWLAKQIFNELNKKGAKLGNASVPIIASILEQSKSYPFLTEHINLDEFMMQYSKDLGYNHGWNEMSNSLSKEEMHQHYRTMILEYANQSPTTSDKRISEEGIRKKLISEFKDSVSGDMYKHIDDHDYSLGMEQIDDSEIHKSAELFADDFIEWMQDQQERKELDKKWDELKGFGLDKPLNLQDQPKEVREENPNTRGGNCKFCKNKNVNKRDWCFDNCVDGNEFKTLNK